MVTLADAISALGAVLVRKEHDEADGFGCLSKTHPALYAVKDGDGAWYVIPEHVILEEATRRVSLAVLRNEAVEVKAAWWTPERQFANKLDLSESELCITGAWPSKKDAESACYTCVVVTVDLATGEEVVA